MTARPIVTAKPVLKIKSADPVKKPIIKAMSQKTVATLPVEQPTATKKQAFDIESIFELSLAEITKDRFTGMNISSDAVNLLYNQLRSERQANLFKGTLVIDRKLDKLAKFASANDFKLYKRRSQ